MRHTCFTNPPLAQGYFFYLIPTIWQYLRGEYSGIKHQDWFKLRNFDYCNNKCTRGLLREHKDNKDIMVWWQRSPGLHYTLSQRVNYFFVCIYTSCVVLKLIWIRSQKQRPAPVLEQCFSSLIQWWHQKACRRLFFKPVRNSCSGATIMWPPWHVLKLPLQTDLRKWANPSWLRPHLLQGVPCWSTEQLVTQIFTIMEKNDHTA